MRLPSSSTFSSHVMIGSHTLFSLLLVQPTFTLSRTPSKSVQHSNSAWHSHFRLSFLHRTPLFQCSSFFLLLHAILRQQNSIWCFRATKINNLVKKQALERERLPHYQLFMIKNLLILILFLREYLEELNTWDLWKTERHSNPIYETECTNIFDLK